jgi:hypothetical protein
MIIELIYGQLALYFMVFEYDFFLFNNYYFLECLFGKPIFPFITINDLIDKIKSSIPIEVKQFFELLNNFFKN